MAQTKAQRARALAYKVAKGPASLDGGTLTRAGYNLWMSTWILPEIVELIPQLKDFEYRPITTVTQDFVR